jgi:hypothetical protein
MADNFEQYSIEVDAMLSDRAAQVFIGVDHGSGDMNVEVEVERLQDGTLKVNDIRTSERDPGQQCQAQITSDPEQPPAA